MRDPRPRPRAIRLDEPPAPSASEVVFSSAPLPFDEPAGLDEAERVRASLAALGTDRAHAAEPAPIDDLLAGCAG